MQPVQTWLEHIRYLTIEIGPRGSTTPAERQGHEYCQKVLNDLGLDARLETFTSARSIFQPHLFAGIGMLIAFVLYPLAGRASALAAAILALVILVSEVLELGFLTNPIRWLLSKGPSQNTVACLPPSGQHTRDLVLIGHVDSQRTPIVFSTPRWVTIYENFITVAFVTFIGMVVLYFLGAVTQWPWIWPVSAVAALCALLLIALAAQADSTPFTAGANDNASAVGMVLTLAEQLKAQPLEHTRVWLVCSGCEEVQHYGAVDFFKRHQQEMVNPASIAFEMLGCAGPAWQTKEGIIVPFLASPHLVALAEKLAAEHPQWGAYGAEIKGGNTEMADGLRVGIPSITLTGLTRKGKAPYWHTPQDTFDKMNPEIMARAYDFALTYVRALDQAA
jgi:hypothetical protein